MQTAKIRVKHIAVSSETLTSPYEAFLTNIISTTKQSLYLNKYRFLGGVPLNQEEQSSTGESSSNYTIVYIPILFSQKIDINDSIIEVPEIYTISPPPEIDHKLSLCVLLASLRIYSALYLKAKCVEKETVLIMNSTSCWGYLACQLACLTGCTVIAETNSATHYNFIKRVQHTFKGKRIIQSSTENVAEVIKEETLGRGVDCVIDFYPSHTSDSKRNLIECLATGGRWVTIDSQLQLDLPETECMFYKNGSLNFLFDEAYEVFGMELGKVKTMMEEALLNLKEGKLNVFLENEYSSIKEFEENLANGSKFGSSIINLEKESYC